MSKKTRIIVAVSSAVILIAAVIAVNVGKSSRGGASVQTQKAERRDLVSTVTASGEVRPKRYVNVSSDVPGRIVKLLVREGEKVRQGQPLCRIDATRFEASMRGAEAALQASRADLRRALADLEATQIGFERTKKMFADKLVSAQAFDQAEADIKMRQASVEAQRRRIAQTEAALESDSDNLHKTTVVAPMSGVVTLLLKEEGETVIGAQSFTPTVIMTIADLSVMETEVMADETDIRDLHLEQPVEVRVDALPNVKIKGAVTEIGASAIVRGASAAAAASSGSTANQAKDFKVTITLKDPPAEIRPGLNATAEIETARKQKVLAVPIQAVVVREVDKDGKVVDPGAPPAPNAEATPQTGTRARGEEREGVFVVAKGQAIFRAVKTGIMGESDIEILEGLSEGDEIVTGPYKTLRTLRNEARIKAANRPTEKKAS